jgi:Raf kinase inhibitor-like YbhB/YbcL family protein
VTTRPLALVPALLLVLAGCGGGDSESASAPDPSAPATITVTSRAFADGASIPSKYTCGGDEAPPDVAWSDVPSEVGSLALVVDDPDAPDGGYVHWVVVGIPASARGGIDAGALPGGASELEASGGPGWSPPCPPSGTHHYRFTVYAFPSDTSFTVSGDTPLDGVLSALADQAIAWGRLTGTVTASGGDSGGGY